MKTETAARNARAGYGAPGERESAGNEDGGREEGSPAHPSGARLRAGASDVEDSDLDSGRELPFTD